MRIVVIHLLIALAWFLLSPERRLLGLITGWIITYPLLFLIRDFIGANDYLNRSKNFILFLYLFSKEFILANFQVLSSVWLKPTNDLKPGFTSVEVGKLKTVELILLSHCITLTPGTSTIEAYKDESENYILLIHYLNSDCPNEIQELIIENLLNPILKFTRS